MFHDREPGAGGLRLPLAGVHSFGSPVHDVQVTLGDMAGVFEDEELRSGLPPHAMVYSTQVCRPVPEGTEGSLFYGLTMVMPGMVGAEYFMTRGHFHARRDRAEVYWCLRGEGLLVLMDEGREWRVEAMRPGTAHHIPGHTAHRAVNTGQAILTFSACWPSDAGHDYEPVLRAGFPVRVYCVDGVPEVLEAAR